MMPVRGRSVAAWWPASLALAAVAAFPGPAAAASPELSLEHATRILRPGQQAIAIVQVAGAQSCRLRAGNARRTAVLEGGTRVRYRFTVARTARAGRHTVTVTCGAAKVAYTLTVRRTARRSSGTLVAGPVTALVSGRPPPVEEEKEAEDERGRGGGAGADVIRGEPLPFAPPRPPPRTSPDSTEVTDIWLKEIRPLFEAKSGECTQWAFEKRPDVVERAERFGIARWLDAGRTDGRYPLTMALAASWADGARDAGFTVDQTPAVGAIMVEPGNPGHVAYVEALGTDELGAYFQVTEMNAPQKGVVTARRVDAAVVLQERLQFIH